MADRDGPPVERQDVIVVVAGREPRVHDDRSLIREIKAIQQAPAVVNQRLAVLGPVRRLERLGRAVHDRTVPARDIEDLQIAPDVVLVRHEPVAHGCRNAYGTEGGALHPNLRCGSTPGPSNCARAVRMTFPSMRRHTKWKASRSNHMLAPDPAIV